MDPYFLLLMASSRSTKDQYFAQAWVTRNGHLHNHAVVTTDQTRPKQEPLEDHPCSRRPGSNLGTAKKSEGSETHAVNVAHHIDT